MSNTDNKTLQAAVSKIDDLRLRKITDADDEAYDRHLYEIQMDIFKVMDELEANTKTPVSYPRLKEKLQNLVSENITSRNQMSIGMPLSQSDIAKCYQNAVYDFYEYLDENPESDAVEWNEVINELEELIKESDKIDWNSDEQQKQYIYDRMKAKYQLFKNR